MTLPALRTERLWLRALRADDAADLHAAFGDPACMRWWHRPPAESVEESARAVAEMLEHDAGHWVFGLKGSGEALGYVGFVASLHAGGHAGFGYAVRRSEWGRGYTPEAATAALSYGFGEIGIARAELWIHRENRQSVRVAEKLGCLRRAEVYLAYESGPAPSLVYGVTAEAWRGESEPPPTHYSVAPILAVGDVAAAVRWWRDVLGFHVDFLYGDPPAHAGMRLDPPWTGGGGVQLTRAPTEAGRGMVFIFAGPDIDRLASHAVAAGAEVVAPLGERPWGMREIELRDPDGNRVRMAAPA